MVEFLLFIKREIYMKERLGYVWAFATMLFFIGCVRSDFILVLLMPFFFSVYGYFTCVYTEEIKIIERSIVLNVFVLATCTVLRVLEAEDDSSLDFIGGMMIFTLFPLFGFVLVGSFRDTNSKRWEKIVAVVLLPILLISYELYVFII